MQEEKRKLTLKIKNLEEKIDDNKVKFIKEKSEL